MLVAQLPVLVVKFAELVAQLAVLMDRLAELEAQLRLCWSLSWESVGSVGSAGGSAHLAVLVAHLAEWWLLVPEVRGLKTRKVPRDTTRKSILPLKSGYFR